MGNPNAILGRDPGMDRAVARVERHIYLLEHTTPDAAVAHELKVSARDLWKAVRDLDEPDRRQLRPSIRTLVVACADVELSVRAGEDFETVVVKMAFGTLVRTYRRTRLRTQAARFGTDEGGPS